MTNKTYNIAVLPGDGIGPEVINGIDRMAGCIAVVSDAITNNGWLILGIVVASFVPCELLDEAAPPPHAARAATATTAAPKRISGR